MCQTYSFAHELEYIAYADSQKYAEVHKERSQSIGYGRKIYLNSQLLNENIFYLEYQGKKRYIRPDSIIFSNMSDNQTRTSIDKLNNLMCMTTTSINKNSSRGKNSKNQDSLKIIIKKTNDKIFWKWSSEFIGQLNKLLGVKKATHQYYATFDQVSKNHYMEAFKRTLAIFEEEEKSNSNLVRIRDYKYHSKNYFHKNSDKLINDVKKQHVYELTLKTWFSENPQKYKHEFIIPLYGIQPNELKSQIVQSDFLKKSNIELIGFNFLIIQDFYIKHEIQ